ncbi:hypothetical protein Sgly_2197 [Syntrophobotulus glycolicus DSM 8271]|uniref:Uncharacterized protein n=1 Tax=Syntrophobotulus glycolicus (strain DSM 8271 / FlGlyR) TaxID=645991 RepID=F0STW3_SYNGF|nr:hypothetical protein [Syntrophobotulus glycolicus]ADY56486.1 hypothetical protein Sgly_2197 [Syntrophobotulus glycolicus DSM 8271]
MDEVNWKLLCEQNPEVFAASEWNIFSEEKRRKWHLPSQYCYLQAGGMNLRIGIIAAQKDYKEEDFLLAGVLFGSRIGNGVRTLIYFVAPDFNAVFFKAISQLGGSIIAKAVYWRKKLTPSLYLVRNYSTLSSKFTLEKFESGWNKWEKQINPVDRRNLLIIKQYFESLIQRRVRTVFKKKQILFCWGNLEIAEIKMRENRIELATKVRWTRNKDIVLKFQKTGWIDSAGKINEEFCQAVDGMIDLLENMEMTNGLEAKDKLALQLIYDKEAIKSQFGKWTACPWTFKEREVKLFDPYNLYFFQKNENEINIIIPVIEKPMFKIVCALIINAVLCCNHMGREENKPEVNIQWNGKIFLLCLSEYKEEIGLCSQWLKDMQDFPVIFLPDHWRDEGLRQLKE